MASAARNIISAVGDDCEITFVETHHTGRQFTKLAGFTKRMASIPSLIRRSHFDLAHLHVAKGGSIVRKALLLALLRAHGIPTICHFHSGAIESIAKRSAATRLLLKIITRAASFNIALSPHWGKFYANFCAETKIKIIRNCVPESSLLPVASDRAFARPLFFFAGTLVSAKGIHELIDAAQGLCASGIKFDLVIAGEGSERSDLLSKISKRDLAGQVHLVGWLDQQQRDEYINNATAVLLPSHFEAQPMIIIEAFALGTPVIASRVGGIPELFDNCEPGILITPRSVPALQGAMLEFIEDPTKRTSMGNVARHLYEVHHSFSSTRSILIDLYRTISGKTHTPPKNPDENSLIASQNT